MIFSSLATQHVTVTPGADTLAHYQTIAQIQQGKISLANLLAQPTALHAATAGISNLFNISAENVYRIFAALALPLSALSLAFLARVLFGRSVAVVTLLLAAFISLQPWQTYADGTIPNIYGAGILLPVTVALTVLARRNFSYPKRAWSYATSALITMVLLAYTHHLSTLVALASVSIWALIEFLRAVSSPAVSVRTKVWLGVAVFGGIALAGIALAKLPLFGQARAIIDIFVNSSPEFPYFVFTTTPAEKPAWTVFLFGQDMGGFIFQGALAGGTWVLARSWFQRLPIHSGRIFVVAWLAVYAVGAFSSWSGEPTRMARDLALPGCILAAVFTVWGFTFLHARRAAVAYVCAATLLLVVLPYSLTKGRQIATVAQHTQFTLADEAAYRYLVENDALSDTTIVTPNFIWQALLQLRRGIAETDQQPFVLIKNEVTAQTAELPNRIMTPCVLLVNYMVPTLSGHATSPIYRETLFQAGFTLRAATQDDRREILHLCR